MTAPTIARTAAEVAEEGQRLTRFRQAYAALTELLPADGGPLGNEASGGETVVDWILGEGPALSDSLEDVLRWGVKEALRSRTAKGPEATSRPPRRG